MNEVLVSCSFSSFLPYSKYLSLQVFDYQFTYLVLALLQAITSSCLNFLMWKPRGQRAPFMILNMTFPLCLSLSRRFGVFLKVLFPVDWTTSSTTVRTRINQLVQSLIDLAIFLMPGYSQAVMLVP